MSDENPQQTRTATAASCPNCGFVHHCICHAEVRLHAQAIFVLLTHSKEFGKSTNTGALMARTLPHCQRVLWSRTEPPEALLTLIADDQIQPWLLFPADDTHPPTPFAHEAGKTPLFILLDATWQEARKIVRKSPWLAKLPRLSLSLDRDSAYTLRRNQQTGHLCTCETGIALLELLGEHQDAKALQQYFDAFLAAYPAEKSGHPRRQTAP
ncbi:tRNA-uridine aminocarboxypropyltransferase [Photobacterium halotolerans]|uniref:tRNA-uridine aminocarboxypropyltransferase n=1 Tax=Photobacterium halotolerans TaxID=265726 RepID=UPI0006191D0B|nr:DTW domain-containing protein [Photobacterium halotolerans]